MRLPLKLSRADYGRDINVSDAEGKVVARFYGHDGAAKVALSFVRRFNQDWRYRWFGVQPYVFTREDYFYGREPQL